MNRGAVALESERLARSWSQRDLARELGIDEPSVSRLLRGLKKPDRENSVKIRDRLGIDPSLWDEPTSVVVNEPPTNPEEAA